MPEESLIVKKETPENPYYFHTYPVLGSRWLQTREKFKQRASSKQANQRPSPASTRFLRSAFITTSEPGTGYFTLYLSFSSYLKITIVRKKEHSNLSDKPILSTLCLRRSMHLMAVSADPSISMSSTNISPLLTAFSPSSCRYRAMMKPSVLTEPSCISDCYKWPVYAIFSRKRLQKRKIITITGYITSAKWSQDVLSIPVRYNVRSCQSQRWVPQTRSRLNGFWGFGVFNGTRWLERLWHSLRTLHASCAVHTYVYRYLQIVFSFIFQLNTIQCYI